MGRYVCVITEFNARRMSFSRLKAGTMTLTSLSTDAGESQSSLISGGQHDRTAEIADALN
jgi:hypothetical protein